MGDTHRFLFEYRQYIEDIETPGRDEYIYREIVKRSKFGRLALVEGLIYTQPPGVSAGILRRRFPGLSVEVEEDGEIFIQGLDAPLSEYMPLITNLGYFVAKWTGDGIDWSVGHEETDRPLAIFLEPKYDYEVEVPARLYHASPIRHRDKILRVGLSPRADSKLSRHPERVYLTDSIDMAISFGRYLAQQTGNDWYRDGYCIFSVDGAGVPKLYSDVNLRRGGFYTVANISPRHISLISEVA